MHKIMLVLAVCILLLVFVKRENFDLLPVNETYFLECTKMCQGKKEECLKFVPTGENCNFQNAYCIQDCLWTSKFK